MEFKHPTTIWGRGVHIVQHFVRPGLIALCACLLGCSVTPGGNDLLSNQDNALYEPITQSVKGLGYSDSVAVNFVNQMFRRKSNTANAVYWKEALMSMHDKEEPGEIAKQQMQCVRALAHRINHGISSDRAYSDLQDVLAEKKANCVGYVQIFHVLAQCVGLHTRPVLVWELQRSEEIRIEEQHVCTLITLADGKVAFLDLALPGVNSQPFEFETVYRSQGSTFELRTNNHPENMYQEIELLDINGLKAIVCNSRGVAYASSQQFDRAIQSYDQAIALNHGCVMAWNNRGVAHQQLGNLDCALVDYSKAIELHPPFSGALNNRGSAWVTLGEYEPALMDFEKVIALTPNCAQAYNNRANVYIHMNQMDRALLDYQKAIELNPKLAQVYYNRGSVYHTYGEYQQAVRNYTRAIRYKPTLYHAYISRGLTYAMLGDYTKAKRDLVCARELSPTPAIIERVEKISERFRLDLG
jgi:tetratricopeptide (TPR) repeat protein